jgi:hypothetical protein
MLPNFEPVNLDGLGPDDLTRIVALSGLNGTSLPPSNHLRKTVWYGGRLFKVRAYQSVTTAQEKLKLLCMAQALFPRCYGRVSRFLIFDYVNSVAANAENPIPRKIGTFLSTLAQVEAAPLSQSKFDSQCQALLDSGILLPRTADLATMMLPQETLSLPDKTSSCVLTKSI